MAETGRRIYAISAKHWFNLLITVVFVFLQCFSTGVVSDDLSQRSGTLHRQYPSINTSPTFLHSQWCLVALLKLITAPDAPAILLSPNIRPSDYIGIGQGASAKRCSHGASLLAPIGHTGLTMRACTYSQDSPCLRQQLAQLCLFVSTHSSTHVLPLSGWLKCLCCGETVNESQNNRSRTLFLGSGFMSPYRRPSCARNEHVSKPHAQLKSMSPGIYRAL
ncbi:uncharacterized protein F5Z01DRAFT_393542 [Emericellopsis atlantica]|uniref:Uncharacterized protein n=1 Tax=Emericellopsis atlantica TaxID=2614577 RepID=A0A9P7ZTK2_9HYPO|nr:uncharacterized protein F5Z01DRAFT_393542 [Emericellopsis atlantica]KAG9257522.1 hypothetical protein F5Z01DRAFT_393542 [Emericellopsis atlantica]